MTQDNLQELINSLPEQIIIKRFGSNDKELNPKVYDLIIFRYRNTVMYRELKYKTNGGMGLYNTLIEFYDGELIDNIKKMISYFEDNISRLEE